MLRLYSLYWETEPLPLPDTSSPHCVEVMAATGIYIHLRKKAIGENLRFSFSLPPALKLHHEFLLSASTSPCSLDLANLTYNVPLLCNTFSTSQDLFQLPMSALVEAVGGSTTPSQDTTPMPGTKCVAAPPVTPLPMEVKFYLLKCRDGTKLVNSFCRCWTVFLSTPRCPSFTPLSLTFSNRYTLIRLKNLMT